MFCEEQGKVYFLVGWWGPEKDKNNMHLTVMLGFQRKLTVPKIEILILPVPRVNPPPGATFDPLVTGLPMMLSFPGL